MFWPFLTKAGLVKFHLGPALYVGVKRKFAVLAVCGSF